ncbi:MAG: leucyl aminopeptidase [Desulfobacteraceae bacterium]|jgi:leucyl aminopeptidase
MIAFTSVSLAKSKIEMLAVPDCEDRDIHKNSDLKKTLAAARSLEEYSGGHKQQVMLLNPDGTRTRRCVCVGLGKSEEITPDRMRIFAGQAVKAALKSELKRLVIAVPEAKPLGLSLNTLLAAIMEGAILANHAFNRYKEKPKTKPLQRVLLLAPSQTARRYKHLIDTVEAVCRGTLQARDWTSTPSNDKVPAQFARAIAAAARKSGLKTRVMNEAFLKKDKFGALLAVSVGSKNGPRLVELDYAPRGAKQTIVLVGKGVTFDTGGVNLKPSTGLSTMKVDMAGAASVAASMLAVARLKPKHRVVGLMPLVENMISGSATRPGDVVTSFDGKTVEIGNTDAEGRLILIDAMAYAKKKFKPDVMIDMATLTGACVVALGEKIAGVFSPDDALAQAIVESGNATEERCWRMPLPEDYGKLLKSDVADISNMPASRYGGAITAALFLSEFVGDTRWAHIDIAGTAYTKKATDYCGPGGTGFGVRLICDWIQKL